MTEIHINDLPLETFVEILRRVDGRTLGRCRGVSRDWKDKIDELDYLWKEKCGHTFKHASALAKRKSGNDCRWFYIFRNLSQWKNFSEFEITVKELYRFQVRDKTHLLDVDYGILQVRDTVGTLLFDTSTFNCIPIAMAQPNCYRLASTDHVTIAQIKSGLVIQRSVDSPEFMTEEYFRADDFYLTKDYLYFFFDTSVYKCNLRAPILEEELIYKTDEFFFKSIVHSDDKLHLFTGEAQIVNIDRDNKVTITTIDVPWDWIRHMLHVRAVNDNNYVYYSRNIFKLATDEQSHLYLEFPPITALCFYVDNVIFGTKGGKILVYRLSNQIEGEKPIFETIATLPNKSHAVKLDVCEGKTGPTIIVATFYKVYLIELNFFPPPLEEERQRFPIEKQLLYKRLLRLKTRIHL